MSTTLDREWRNPLDQEHRARISEYEIDAAKRLESVEPAAKRWPGLIGHATAPGGEIVVEATAFQRILRVDIPSHRRHAALVLPATNRALKEETRHQTLGKILDNREKRPGLWADVQKAAPGAFAGDPADTRKLHALLDIAWSDEEWAAALVADGYQEDEYDFWAEGEPRVSPDARRKLRELLAEWTLAIEPSAEVPAGYLRSKTEREDWADIFDPAAQKALAGNAEAVAEARRLIATPVRAGLVLPTGESCLVTVQHGRIVDIEFPGQLGREGDPLGQLAFWTYCSAVEGHQETWYREIADHLPCPHDRDPDLPRRYRAFKPVPHSGEPDEIRERREAFQQKTTVITRERN